MRMRMDVDKDKSGLRDIIEVSLLKYGVIWSIWSSMELCSSHLPLLPWHVINFPISRDNT